jgi:hypothetical protein
VNTTPVLSPRVMATATDSRSTRTSQARALLVFILIMLGIAGGTGWLVARGLALGETWFPAKRISSARVIERAREPVMFWTAVGLYGVLCGGAAGFAGWLAREGLRAPDGVFRRSGLPAHYDDSDENRPTDRSPMRETMTLAEARALIAHTPSAKERAAADQLMNEAIALPQLPPEERAAAFLRIRKLDSVVPDYQLRSFGASVLEIIGDSLADPAVKKVIYAEAWEHAARYASGASSGGEGTARSRHVREIEAKLQALEAGSRVASSVAATLSAASALPQQIPPSGSASIPSGLSQQPSTRRPAFLTALGWVFIIAGALATPVSLISALMIVAGGDGTASGSLFGGLIVIGGPPATLISGIGLLRRRHWAYAYALAVLGVFATYSLVQIVRGSTPERSTVSPSGVITTVLASSPSYPLHFLIITICVGLLVKLRSPAIRAEFAR